MKIHQLITDNFTPEQIQMMINQSSIHYDEDSQDVDYFLFSLEDDTYLELRTDEGELEILDRTIVNTDDLEMNPVITKEELIKRLTENKTKFIPQLDID